MNYLINKKEDIFKLCKNYKVKSLYVFGSILTNEFNEKSDIDLIVDFSKMKLEKYEDNYFDFKFSLEYLLKRKIDLLEEKALKNPYFLEKVNSQKKIFYEN